MEESPSVTSSDVTMSREEYDELIENLKLNAAVAVVLLEQAGGAAEFTPDDLSAIDLSQVNVELRFDTEKDLYTIERVLDE